MSPPRPEPESNRVSLVIDEIDRRIGNGMIRPGDRLVELDLAAMLGVSRVPVREAIRILAGEGILEMARGRGARVRPTDGRSVTEIVKILTAFAKVAAADFIERPDIEAGVEILRQISARIDKLSERTESLHMLRAIGRYHWELTALSGNAFLLDTLRRMRLNLYFVHLVEAAGDKAVARFAPKYAGLTDALERRDLRGAKRMCDALQAAVVTAVAARATA